MTVKTILIYSNIPDTLDVFLLEGDYSRFHECFTNSEAKPGLTDDAYEDLCAEVNKLYEDCWSKLPPTDPRVLVSSKDLRDVESRTFMLNNFERVKVIHCGFLL